MPEDEIKILRSKSVDPTQKEAQKKKIELIALAILVPILLYVTFTTFVKKPKQPGNSPQNSLASAARSAPAASGIVTPAPAASAASGKINDNSWGSNPFSPRHSDQGESSAIQLQGIVVKGRGAAYALISNKIVKLGDRIADNTVREIRNDQVILQSDAGEEVVLRR